LDIDAEQLAGATAGGLLFGCATGIAALDGEGAGTDGKEGTTEGATEGTTEGVPPPPPEAVGEGEVAGRAFGDGAGVHPEINRTRPAISMPTPSFRLPVPRLLPLLTAAIAPATNPVRPISTTNAPTLITPHFVRSLTLAIPARKPAPWHLE
jgi:hypothetical protein